MGKKRHEGNQDGNDPDEPDDRRAKKASRTGRIDSLTLEQLEEREEQLKKDMGDLKVANANLTAIKREHAVAYGVNEIRAIGTKKLKVQYNLTEVQQERSSEGEPSFTPRRPRGRRRQTGVPPTLGPGSSRRLPPRSRTSGCCSRRPRPRRRTPPRGRWRQRRRRRRPRRRRQRRLGGPGAARMVQPWGITVQAIWAAVWAPRWAAAWAPRWAAAWALRWAAAWAPRW
ncbi:unnamed protein product, partial [Prorocentrum cordatum]